MDRVKILNIEFDNLSLEELLLQLERGFVFTPNVDFFVRSQKDREFYDALQTADYVVCDSQLVLIASKFLGKPLKEKLSGSDLFPKYCEYHKDNDKIKIFIMGAMEGVAKMAQKNINNRLGREIVIDTYSPKFGYEKDLNETQKMIDLFNQSEANILAFGTGTPKSEKWLVKHSEKLKADVIFSIGATIDFEAGNVARAPKWMSNNGLEWLYRLRMEPKKLWKRYLLDDPLFFWLILKDKLGLYRDPFTNH